VIFLPDGTGEPNEEGLNYYNSLIDALLDKGIPCKFLLPESTISI
jgi:beta-glucosidase/6-phospho-beta-glucosidase/beta-galactosidase